MEKSCSGEELELDDSPPVVDGDGADRDDHPGEPGHPGQRLLDFRASWHQFNGNNFHDDTILGPVEDRLEASSYLPFMLALVQF